MTEFRQGSAGSPDGLPPQARRVVASFDNYAEAQRAVDSLADRRFPVERVAIVGRDLQFFEQVTGRLNYGRVALRGAVQGALLGLLLGWVFGLFNWIDPLVAGLTLAFYGLIVGAILGALFGVLAYALTGGQRDFSTVGGMRASRYEVLVDDEVADEAARLLAEGTRAGPAGTRPERPAAG